MKINSRCASEYNDIVSEMFHIILRSYNLSNVCLFVCLFVCSSTPPRSLGRSSPNLEGRWRAAPDISLRDSFFERSRSSRSKVKFMFFCLFVPYFSQVLGPIFTKLGGKVEGGPRY